MQGTWVWSLVGELKSQMPAHHNYWVLAPQRKILHEATKIPSVPTETQGSQINKVNGASDYSGNGGKDGAEIRKEDWAATKQVWRQ